MIHLRIWVKSGGWYKCDPERQSSLLFDTVAVHLAYSNKFLKMKTMKIIIDDKGFTRKSDTGQPINVAIAWSDLDGYHKYLVERLITPARQV
jgi:hypothetical protein